MSLRLNMKISRLFKSLIVLVYLGVSLRLNMNVSRLSKSLIVLVYLGVLS